MIFDNVVKLRISIHAPHAGCDSSLLCAEPFYPYFNPRTPCGVRPMIDSNGDGTPDISIHAPHAGCDNTFLRVQVDGGLFQSTHPMRGATCPFTAARRKILDFNPRTPCGVRPALADKMYSLVIISIHAPHAGCDDMHKDALFRLYHFNPRTPCGVRRAET